MRRPVRTVLCRAALLGAIPQVLYGYVDPGSGILALQMIAAAVVGVLFQFRRCAALCAKLFKRVKN
jgi:hypothetical protein